MQRATFVFAVVATATALTSAGFLSWVLIEPREWLPGAYNDGKTVTTLRTELADARSQIAGLRRQTAALETRLTEQRPYILAVNALCHAFRTAKGLNDSEEYAIEVARGLVAGVVDSCAWAEVPATTPSKP